MSRLTRTLAALAAGVLAFLLLPAVPAAAHAALISTNPAQGSTVQTAPAEVTLTFSESITPVPDKIRITAPDGSRADRGTATAVGAVLHIPLRSDAPIGTYLVSYRIISADTHPVPGGFTFNIGAPSASIPTPDVGKTDSLVAVAIPVFKFLGYAGLLLVVGPALILLLLWPRRLDRRAPKRLLFTGFGLLGVATVMGIVLQAPYVNGKSLWQTTGSDLGDVINSQYGAVMLARLGVLVVAAIVLSAALRRAEADGVPVKSDLIVLAVLGVLGAATWPLVGHSAASVVPPVTVVVDAIHVGAMAVWLGGLVMLAVFLLRQAQERELAAIMPIWSRWATLAVSALLLAGIVSALIEISSLDALFSTTYGRLILVKIALVAAVLGFAYFARKSVHDAPSGAVLRRSVRAEIAITVVVLGVSSVLTQTTPARTADNVPAASQSSAYFSTTATADLYTLQVDFEPAKVGENTVHLYAYTKEGKPQKVLEWAATAALPSGGIEPVTIPLLPLTDNHASGSIQLPTAGSWDMKFTLRTTDIDQESVTVTVPIG
ncbi:copper resistance CopC/CopD family protein [Hamadaea tsunoensis]|uniref:copper resistance CopC/CopD family protein n=1 Tax=Hamadaea tsunoensis TaxID=53368 RepID=UPI00040B7958|nr:copper resistance protein CopC [Hamadaea tsunoensis]